MKVHLGLSLAIFLFLPACRAQDLTVHVIDKASGLPVPNALVRLHYGCWHTGHHVELKQQTDHAGVATFRSISLSPLEFCVHPDIGDFATKEWGTIFMSPQEAENYGGKLDPAKTFTALPADITFHVYRYTPMEKFKNFFGKDNPFGED